MSDKAEGEEPEEREGAGGFFAIYMTLGVLVFYVLSPAPVAWIFTQFGLKHNEHAVEFFHFIYAPIIWAIFNISAANKFYMWQFDIFGVH